MGRSQTFGTDQASSLIAKHKPLVRSWVHLPKNLKSRSFVMLFLALLCYFHGVCLKKNQIVQCYFQLNSLVCVLFFDNCLVLPLASCSPEFLSCYLQPTAVGNQGQVFWGGGGGEGGLVQSPFYTKYISLQPQVPLFHLDIQSQVEP